MKNDFYKRSKEQILKSLANIYPPIANYFHTVKWTVTDEGTFPSFDVLTIF